LAIHHPIGEVNGTQAIPTNALTPNSEYRNAPPMTTVLGEQITGAHLAQDVPPMRAFEIFQTLVARLAMVPVSMVKMFMT
jgi:hypothetical protein